MSNGAIACSRLVLSRFMLLRPTSVPCSTAVTKTAARNKATELRSFSQSVTGTQVGGDQDDKTTYSSASKRSPQTRRSTAAAPTEGYVSPYEKLFERMHTNAPTILGTTDEYLEWEKERRSKKLECGMPEHVLRFTTRSWGRVRVEKL
jgi:hypothetical protein